MMLVCMEVSNNVTVSKYTELNFGLLLSEIEKIVCPKMRNFFYLGFLIPVANNIIR